jgi:cyanophycinase
MPCTRIITALALLLTSSPLALVAADEAPTIGPAHGTLFIGGGHLAESLMRDFVKLAGGPETTIIVIPTATEGDHFGHDSKQVQLLRDAGAEHLKVLHTRDRHVADSESFVEPLEKAHAVWISGGRQWRLVDAYLGTRTEAALRGVLDRGGVIGGSSAGASIQASFLVRGDPRGNRIVISPDYQEGFGFLRHTAIDQHVLVRGREGDLLKVIERHPKLLGIGIDENTAVVVHGDHLRVIGSSRVAIYNAAMNSDDEPYLLLSPGDAFDLRSRLPQR